MSNDNKFDKDEILHDPSLSVIYHTIRGLAKELAVLGKIDFASQITDLLLSQNRTEHGFGQMQFLNFAFEQTCDWPSAIPKSARSKKALNELEISRDDEMSEKRYDELINEKEHPQQDPVLCLAIAIKLCEDKGKTNIEGVQQDERVIKALGQIAEHFEGYIEGLTQQRNVWPLLASGALAQHLGVDDAKLKAAAEDVVETVRVRMQEGRQKCDHEGKPIKELLEMLAENTRKNAGDHYEEMDKEPPESYLHEPATEKDIKDMEKRLKISSLPDDYKEFLLASNGLEPVFDGIMFTPPLYSTQDVVLSDLPNDMKDIKIPLELVEDSTGTARLITEFGYDDWPTVTKQIEIGQDFEPCYLLTDPSDTKAAIQAYKDALASDKVSEVYKADTTRAIEDLYGSMEAFEKMEWAMIYNINFDPNSPVGTFRTWLEEAVRASSKPYDRSGVKTCLAHECRAKRARRG
jgi:hypothetical protein